MDLLEEENFPEYQKFDTLQVTSITSNNHLDPESFNEIFVYNILNFVHEHFQQYLNILRSNNGTTSTVWMSYVDLTTLMLDFI